jgi:hypothetical protein
MRLFNRNKIAFNLIGLIAFTTGAILFSYDYLNGSNTSNTIKIMKLVGAVSLGILSIYMLIDLVSVIMKKTKS